MMISWHSSTGTTFLKMRSSLIHRSQSSEIMWCRFGWFNTPIPAFCNSETFWNRNLNVSGNTETLRNWNPNVSGNTETLRNWSPNVSSNTETLGNSSLSVSANTETFRNWSPNASGSNGMFRDWSLHVSGLHVHISGTATTMEISFLRGPFAPKKHLYSSFNCDENSHTHVKSKIKWGIYYFEFSHFLHNKRVIHRKRQKGGPR